MEKETFLKSFNERLQLNMNFGGHLKSNYRLLNCILNLFEQKELEEIFENLFSNIVYTNSEDFNTNVNDSIEILLNLEIYSKTLFDSLSYEKRNFARMSLYNFVQIDNTFKNIIIETIKEIN